ncbi:MAG: hypothetical protein WC975_11390 [Phycisphaerae bacterium]
MSGQFEEPMKLFQNSQGTTGIVVLCIFFGAMLTWVGFALMSYLRTRRLEKLPAITGSPNTLLDQVCSLAGLGISDRHLLKKVAFRMKLPQPTSILLSPALLLQAAKTWKQTHRFSPTQNWGINRLDHIARQVFGKPLSDLT